MIGRWRAERADISPSETSTMSRIPHASTLRSLFLAGTLSAAALAAPRASHAQTGHAYRALLNRVALPSVAPHAVALWQTAASLEATAGTVSGERALLARTAYNPALDPAGPDTSQPTPSLAVDGGRALLGRSKGAPR
ncbi:MAG: hypothetical protein ACREOF_08645 [Gemmatimonadales bacterium]